MPTPWPASLQQLVNRDSFSMQFGETVLRSDNDIGPVKVRRRFTRPINKVTVGFDMTVDQYEDFYTFFNTTINGGVTTFELEHPITGVLTEWRFNGPPQVTPLGGIIFQASMEWEEIGEVL